VLFSDSLLVFESAGPESGCASKYWEFEYCRVRTEGLVGVAVFRKRGFNRACGAVGNGVRLGLARASWNGDCDISSSQIGRRKVDWQLQSKFSQILSSHFGVARDMGSHPRVGTRFLSS
jgi:hypothetical protein